MAFNVKIGLPKNFGKSESSQFLSIFLQIITMALAVFTVFFISVQQGLEQVGTFVFFTTIQQVFGFMATLGASSFAIRILNRTKYPVLVFSILFRHAGIVLCVFLLLIAAKGLFGNYLGENFTLCLIAIWLGLVRYMLEDVCAGLHWFSRGSFIGLIETSVRLLAVTVVELDSGAAALTVLILSTGSAIALCGYQILSRFPPGRTLRLPAHYRSVFYRNAAIMYSSHLTALAQGRFAIMAGPYFLSSSQMGAFVILLNLSEIALRAGGLINRYIFSISSIRHTLRERIDPSLIIRFVMMFCALLVVILFFLFPYVDSYFYEESLKSLHIQFFILCVYSLSYLYFNLSSNLLYGSGKSRAVLYSSSSGFLLSFVILMLTWHNASLTFLCISMTVGIIVSALFNARTIRSG